jgi:hypothetical protein
LPQALLSPAKKASSSCLGIYPKSYSAVWLIAVAHLKRINATTIGASLILQKNGILSMAKACTAGFCE